VFRGSIRPPSGNACWPQRNGLGSIKNLQGFGGTTEIMKEITGHGLGLEAVNGPSWSLWSAS
jgi:hypothetical protein